MPVQKKFGKLLNASRSFLKKAFKKTRKESYELRKNHSHVDINSSEGEFCITKESHSNWKMNDQLLLV